MGDLGMTKNVQVGIEIVSKATEHDREQRYVEAAYLYQLSVEYLNRALQGTAQIFTCTALKQIFQCMSLYFHIPPCFLCIHSHMKHRRGKPTLVLQNSKQGERV